MLTKSVVGPWPIIDPAVSRIEPGVGNTAVGRSSALHVRLDTANLGGNREAFVNCYHNVVGGCAVDETVSYGVALCPIDTFSDSDRPIYVDLSITSCLHATYSNTGDITPIDFGLIKMIPFIGYIDEAGAAIGDGWAAPNRVTDYVVLPHVTNGLNISFHKELLLKSIVSDSLHVDKFLVCGFFIANSESDHIDSNYVYKQLSFAISARYALQDISTQSVDN